MKEQLFNALMEAVLNEGSTGEKRTLRKLKSKKIKRDNRGNRDAVVDSLGNKSITKKALAGTPESFGNKGVEYQAKVAKGYRKGFLSHILKRG